ncbi:MAG: class I SAM-dependent methyltransferase, partial [Acidimicrobiia bacterium]|nr:class I SAM-dependent methyltransferase [Acidimicrobiia bacterium]
MDDRINVERADLEWTGERDIPGQGGPHIAYEHRHRYLAVLPIARGQVVVDLGCGEGYGSAWLARAAEHVVGVDIEAVAVQHAHERYAHMTNLEFVTSDACHVPVRDGTVGVVVCFEALEHLERHDMLLAEVDRILAPNGVFVVSTPAKAVYADAPDHQNPFHVHELYRAEFEVLLRARFPDLEVLGQHLVAGSLLWPLDAEDSRSGFDLLLTRGAGSLEPASVHDLEAVYLVAVCARSPHALAALTLHRSISIDADHEIVGYDVTGTQRRLERLTAELTAHEEYESGLDSALSEELHESELLVERLRDEVEHSQSQLLRLQVARARKRSPLRRMKKGTKRLGGGFGRVSVVPFVVFIALGGRLPGAVDRPPVAGMSVEPADQQPRLGVQGYWIVGADGSVSAFGDAPDFGGLPELGVELEVAGIAPTPHGLGYWIIGKQGQVFTFGNAFYFGGLPELGVELDV